MADAGGPRHVFEEHTGEVRFRVEADTLDELFAEAGRALGELIATEGDAHRAPLEEEEVVVRAADRDALLVAWLDELIYRSETSKRVYLDLVVDSVTERELRARVRGVDIEEVRTAVKAATLHDLHIAERPSGGFATSVVLDV